MQEELPGVLYDFLYRDNNRISSYYAQIFNGRLSILEETDLKIQGHENTGEGNIQVAKVGRKTVESTQSGTKRVIDPHDVATTDVLTHLIGNYN
ncbi:MAG TPA: hypothetical protein PKY82_23845, partial [Pyrinomonadaceae bacterium]|nr:hypothetical protein [Pyrinomonadaceae bacterium]